MLNGYIVYFSPCQFSELQAEAKMV